MDVKKLSKAIRDAKAVIKAGSKGKILKITDAQKQEIIKLSNNIGDMPIHDFALAIGMKNSSTLSGWRGANKNTSSRTPSAFKWGGLSIRIDVGTKCDYVRQYIEENRDAEELGYEIGVTAQTIMKWVKQYADNYTELIALPNGVPFVMGIDKQVIGLKDIQKRRDAIEEIAASIAKEVKKADDHAKSIRAKAAIAHKQLDSEKKELDGAEINAHEQAIKKIKKAK